jgi:hypothetical protein
MIDHLQRLVRHAVITALRDSGEAPSTAAIASRLGRGDSEVASALVSLGLEHRLALLPGTDRVWMAHPFSAIPTDFVVTIAGRRWFANCVWDGLSILALLGDGVLETHSPASGEPIVLKVSAGKVLGEAIVHFLVPARRFWDDIGHT